MARSSDYCLRGDGLNVVIEVKLVRMRTQADRINLSFPFVSEPSFDHILRENVTAKEKSLIVLKRIKGLIQRAGRRFHALRFRGWQIIKVFVDRLARINPTLDAIKACHEHSGER